MATYQPDLIRSLRSLRRAPGAAWGPGTKHRAPYKPLLLMAVMDGIEEGWIRSDIVHLDSLLMERFEGYCRLIQSVGTWDIRLPFHHLSNDPGLWTRLSDTEARIGHNLYTTLQSEHGRDVVRAILIGDCFDTSTGQLLNAAKAEFVVTQSVIADLTAQLEQPFSLDMVTEPPVTRTATQNVRDRAFRIAVRRSYDYTCAVCRSRLITPSGHVLVESAHIVAHSTHANDDPRNGMALCRTHHWLFDRYMLSVRPTHEIELAPVVRDAPNHLVGTLEFEHRRIHVPADSRAHPAGLALTDHYRRFREANQLV